MYIYTFKCNNKSCGEFTWGPTLPIALFLCQESVFISVTTTVPKVHAFLSLLAVVPSGHIRGTHTARIFLKETSCCWKQTVHSTDSLWHWILNYVRETAEKQLVHFQCEWGYMHCARDILYVTSKKVEQLYEAGRSGFSTFSLWRLGVIFCKTFSVVKLIGISNWFCILRIINFCYDGPFDGCISLQIISETHSFN